MGPSYAKIDWQFNINRPLSCKQHSISLCAEKRSTFCWKTAEFCTYLPECHAISRKHKKTHSFETGSCKSLKQLTINQRRTISLNAVMWWNKHLEIRRNVQIMYSAYRRHRTLKRHSVVNSKQLVLHISQIGYKYWRCTSTATVARHSNRSHSAVALMMNSGSPSRLYFRSLSKFTQLFSGR